MPSQEKSLKTRIYFNFRKEYKLNCYPKSQYMLSFFSFLEIRKDKVCVQYDHWEVDHLIPKSHDLNISVVMSKRIRIWRTTFFHI